MLIRRFAASSLLLAFVLALVACSSADSKPEPTAAPGAPLPVARPLPPDLEKMLADVAEVRGLRTPEALKVAYVPRSQVVQLLDSLTTDDDRRWFATTTTLYRLLGHLRKDQDYLTVYQSFGGLAVLGVYSPVDKALWVVTDEPDPALSKLKANEKETLAHELVHAVQDANFDLVTQFRTVADDLDANLAWTALVEGDANTHQRLYADKYLAVPVGRGAGRAMLLGSAPAMQAGVPAAIVRELLFPYTTGADWVDAIRSRSGPAGIDALFRALPRNTAYVLHPELLNTEWRAATVSLPDLSAALGKGFTRESGGTFGEFEVRNWLQSRLKALDASTAAAGWDGDRYDVYVDGKESVAVFRLRFRDDAEARQFADAQQAFLQASNATVTAGEVAVATTPDGLATATTSPRGLDVVFALASTPDLAKRAVEAVVRG